MKESFEDRVNRLRKAAGLSRGALDKAAGLHAGTVARLELGNQIPDDETIAALMKVLEGNAPAPAASVVPAKEEPVPEAPAAPPEPAPAAVIIAAAFMHDSTGSGASERNIVDEKAISAINKTKNEYGNAKRAAYMRECKAKKRAERLAATAQAPEQRPEEPKAPAVRILPARFHTPAQEQEEPQAHAADELPAAMEATPAKPETLPELAPAAAESAAVPEQQQLEKHSKKICRVYVRRHTLDGLHERVFKRGGLNEAMAAAIAYHEKQLKLPFERLELTVEITRVLAEQEGA